MPDNNEFVFAIDEFIAKAGRKQDQFAREFVQDLAEVVMQETPVKTGFLRGSWATSVNAPAAGAATGSESVFIGLNLALAGIKDTFYISNNAKYAPAVEFGTVHMTPRAMVRRSVARAPQIAAQTLKKVVGNG